MSGEDAQTPRGTLQQNRNLLWQFTKRSVVGRYKGSVLGMLWSFLHPVLMLLVYTFVFGIVFGARWPSQSGSGNTVEFALTLFAGLTMFTVFSDVLTRSPTLISSQPNLVKKVVFPLEILPMALVGDALFHGMASIIILLVGNALFLHQFPITLLFLPLLLVPLILMSLGAAWLVSAFGVYVRDIRYSIVVLTTILFFMTPIFYPASAVPEQFRFVLKLNPLATLVDTARRIVIWNELPDWKWFGYTCVISIAMLWVGRAFFNRTKKGFADII